MVKIGCVQESIKVKSKNPNISIDKQINSKHYKDLEIFGNILGGRFNEIYRLIISQFIYSMF